MATIIPLIIAVDKTQLSIMCGGQQAYPVYVTIGNLPKAIRRKVSMRATLLLGYLPVEEFEDEIDPEERSRLKHQLTHDALAVLMEPLKKAAREGVVMTCADGRQRRVYPIPAAFEGDWIEQCSMACTEEGGCPVCDQVFNRRSEYPNSASPRNPNATLTALRAYMESKDRDPGDLKAKRLKPWWPWWASMPYTNFHASIMPDLLHQLNQGMIRHAIAWSKKVLEPEVVDRCLKAMPGTVGLRHFTKGIDKIQQWTGRESKEVAKQLLPVVAGHKDIKPDFVSAIRSILDFAFRAHQSQMTEEDLERLESALCGFHTKKEVLQRAEIYESVDSLNRVPKLHMLTHYAYAIREMGTPDGYNTESPEHLHIIYAKRGWRKSNKVEPLPQMIRFVQRYEAMRIHRYHIDMYYGCGDRARVDSRVVYGEDEDAILEPGPVRADDEEGVLDVVGAEGAIGGGEGAAGGAEEIDNDESDDESEQQQQIRRIKGTRPVGQHVPFNPNWGIAVKSTTHAPGYDTIGTYDASDFITGTNEWATRTTEAGLLPPVQPVTPDHEFDIWHKFYLYHEPLHFDPDQPPHRDTIRARPAVASPPDSVRPDRPGTFDTVLFLARPDEFGIHRK